jgi:hypothetical protein
MAVPDRLKKVRATTTRFVPEAKQAWGTYHVDLPDADEYSVLKLR